MYIDPELLKATSLLWDLKYNRPPDLSKYKIKYSPVRKHYQFSHVENIKNKLAALYHKLVNPISKKVVQIAYHDYMFKNFKFTENFPQIYDDVRQFIFNHLDDSYKEIGLDYPCRRWANEYRVHGA